MSISPALMLPFPARAVSIGHMGGCNVLSMMDDHNVFTREVGNSLHSQKNARVRVSLPGPQRNGECHIAILGEREKQREMGDSQHSNREATDGNLFWQNRLNRFQRPEYSVPLPFSTSFVMKCMNALTRMGESEDRRRIPNFSSYILLYILDF